jgi:hypothetical protein
LREGNSSGLKSIYFQTSHSSTKTQKGGKKIAAMRPSFFEYENGRISLVVLLMP